VLDQELGDVLSAPWSADHQPIAFGRDGKASLVRATEES
jgi:hypothetical protein